MNLHILGICGTFMGGLALLAREAGHRVSGSDRNVYPPMSDQLREQDIALFEGYEPEHIEADTDLVIIGNALSRGNPAVEHVLDEGLPYSSGPQWLGEQVLRGRRVLAVAGTHGKTTTSSLVAWLLEAAGLEPGFLIGGVPGNFGLSARSGAGDWFVIEADEYDTAFFDKRSKFVHYRPEIGVLNNLEYDHADIFPNLEAIETQFHHLLRTVPGRGRLIVHAGEPSLERVLERGCWTPVERFGAGSGADWTVARADDDPERIILRSPSGEESEARWTLSGDHNLANALAAVAAVHAAGVPLREAGKALAGFRSVRRRLELLAERKNIRVYDDFAHHPTAIRMTLEGLRARDRERRLIAVLEPRSNSMRMGAHAEALGPALAAADRVLILVRPELAWDPSVLLEALGDRARAEPDAEQMLACLRSWVRPGDHLVFMSNGGFDALPARFARWLKESHHD